MVPMCMYVSRFKCSSCNDTFDTERGCKVHIARRSGTCSGGTVQVIIFGAPQVGAEMGVALRQRGK